MTNLIGNHVSLRSRISAEKDLQVLLSGDMQNLRIYYVEVVWDTPYSLHNQRMIRQSRNKVSNNLDAVYIEASEEERTSVCPYRILLVFSAILDLTLEFELQKHFTFINFHNKKKIYCNSVLYCNMLICNQTQISELN